MKKKLLKNDNYMLLVGFLVGTLLAGTVAYASLTYIANEIYYSRATTNITSNDVQGAIDELATKYASATCRNDLICIPNS